MLYRPAFTSSLPFYQAAKQRQLAQPGNTTHWWQKLPHVDVRSSSAVSVLLVIVAASINAHWLHPIVFAHVNGFTVIGAHMPERSSRSACLAVAQSWSESAPSRSTISTMIGEYANGARVCATPLPEAPPHVGCTSVASRLRLLTNGASFVWCSLAALRGTPCFDVASRAVIAMQSFVQPVPMLASTFGGSGLFRSGASDTRALDPHADEPPPSSSATRILNVARRSEALLIHALQAANWDGLLDGWSEQVTPPDTSEIPDEVLAAPPSFADELIDSVPFAPITKPLKTSWIPLPPHQPTPSAQTPACPASVWDMLLPAAQLRLKRWINASYLDLLGIHEQLSRGVAPRAVVRTRPAPIAIGESERAEWSRGRVWDCRLLSSPCCVVADFHAPIESDLNLKRLHQRLAHYPDQALLSHLIDGVRFEADVELQTVLVPHLLSLSLGFISVAKEIDQMSQLGWHGQYPSLPFWPMYINGQGSTPRKLEPDRFRRTTEGGGPRRPTRDLSGLEAVPLNVAARNFHMPQYFLSDKRPEFVSWLAARGLPRPADEPPLAPTESKWPRERKPALALIMRDLAILRRAAEALDLPIYVFSDDIATFFSQFCLASSELWKSGIHFINLADSSAAGSSPPSVFVSEKRLGFGMHGASNVAQRFSDALLSLFRSDMDAADLSLHTPSTPAYQRWLLSRQKACNKIQHDRTQPGEPCHEFRLWSISCYTDDMILIVLGTERATKALRVWRELVAELGLSMAKPEKRHAGTHALWLGVLILAPLGICAIPRSKLLRTAVAINNTLAGRSSFAEYRSLCGLLEHLRAVCLKGRNVMFGLYEPHGPQGVASLGPDAKVKCSLLMRKQLLRWKRTLASAGGVSTRRSILRHEIAPPPSLILALCSDACLGDEDPPGMGGFCHGFYWYFAIPPEHTRLVNIPVLEFLAVCGNILTFHPYLAASLGENTQGVLRTDALTTALTLPKESQKSPLLMLAHHELRSTPQFRHLRKHLHVTHLFGDCMAISDRISRGRWAEFDALCRQLRTRPERLQVAEPFVDIYMRIVHLAAHTRNIRGGCNHSLLGALRRQAKRKPVPAAGLAAPPLGNRGHPPSALALIAPTPATSPASEPPPLRRQLGSSFSCPFPLPPAPPSRPDRASSSLTHASALVAQAQATEIAHGGDLAMQLRTTPGQIASIAAATDSIVNYGVNAGTAAKDDRAWDLWCRVCAHFGTAPLRTAADVQRYPSRITFLLTSLMIYARMYCKPHNGEREFIKPKSCLAYPLAIIRVYRRWGIILPGYKSLLACLQGMCRAYAAHHGPDSVAPKKAEPFKFQMARAIFDIADGCYVGGRIWRDDCPEVFIFKRANLFAMSSGARLAALAGTCLTSCLCRSNVSFTFSNLVVTDPTKEQLLNMRDGDRVDVSPAPGKCDAWLEVHAHFPYTFVYRQADQYNVAAALRDIELRLPCRGQDRRKHALFGDAQGRPLPHGFFCSLLNRVLTHLYGKRVASLYTWHSYRSGFATALHAAGISDEVILLLCHWVSPESLRSYRRLSHQEQETAVVAAARTSITLLQPRNAPTVSGDQHYAALLDGLSRSTPHAVDQGEQKRPARSSPYPAASSASSAAAPASTATTRSPPTSSAQTRAPHTPTALPEALRHAPLQGDPVIVNRDAWPTYPCLEHNGLGWEAQVRSATGTSAVVRFAHATTAAGRPYEDVRLPIRWLHPLHPECAAAHGGSAPPPRALLIRGGRNGTEPPQDTPEAPPTRTPAPGPPTTAPQNAVGYPQLVADDFCALCKRALPPLRPRSGTPERRLPTAVETPERLQCERCHRVRYCSSWCAHIHYVACHQFLCPLPAFDTDFSAEYVLREGNRVRAMPIRCVYQVPCSANELNPPPNRCARIHAWSAVRHRPSQQAPTQCRFCLTPPDDPDAPPLHNVWFTGLITRVRSTGTTRSCSEIDWDAGPEWKAPLVVYQSHPRSPTNWPSADPASRVSLAQLQLQ